MPLSLNKLTFVNYKKKRIGSIRFTMVTGNQDLYVICNILKKLKILMSVLYLIFSPDSGKTLSDYEVNESVAEVGDKSNNDSFHTVHV